jgi:type I restriction enzyme S subunit
MKTGMKQTEIGEIPVDWEVVTLKDIAQRVKTKDAGGEHEVLTISAKVGFVRQEDKYNRYMAGKSVENYTLLKQGQFSYNKGNSLTYPFGCIYRLDDYAQALVPNVYISFELSNAVDSEFCRHLFLEGEFIGRLKPFITSGVRGNGLLNVNAEDFFSLAMVLPPFPEQRKIAEILSTLDEKMAVIDEQLAQTQELKKGLMQRLLTKGIGHTQFKDSPLGRIPASWEAKALRDCGTLTGGCAFSSKSFNDTGEGYQVIRMSNVQAYGLELKKAPVFLDKINSKDERYLLQEGEVIITLTGTLGKRDYGNVAYISEGNKFLLNQRVGRFKYEDGIVGKYLFFVFNHDYFRDQFFLGGKGGTGNQANVGKSDFESIIIFIPPVAEQRQVAEILTTMDDKIVVLQDKKAQYHTLKKGLMQQLLTGQRRVRVAEQVPALV